MFESNSKIIKSYYQSYFLAYAKFIFLLTVIGFSERCFFAIYHNHITEPLMFGDILHSLVWGIKFDLALASVFSFITFFAVYLINRILSINTIKFIRISAYLFGSLIFFIQAGDIIYFSDAARHIGYEITDTFNDAPYLLSTAWSVYKIPLLFHIALYAPVLLIIRSVFSNNSIVISNNLKGLTSLNYEGALIISVFLSAILIRGGFQSIPLEPLHAHELSDSRKASLALNGSYNALFNLLNKDQIKPVEISLPANLDVDATIRTMYPKIKTTSSNDMVWKPNIIFIFLESWPAMYMKSYGYNKETTPFFDSLRKKSLSTLEMIAGGHRTTEGMFSSLCSAQNPLGQTIAQSQLQDFEYRCLPHILREQGYRTAFFQGSNKNTSGTGAFAQLLGFSESYGKADIDERIYPENDWGVYDQDLYNHVYHALKENSSPILFGINTNTTHDIALPKTINPAFKLTNSDPKNLNTLHFSDSALKEFFNKVENDSDIGDILWVIVADHTAGLKTSNFNNYRVPFLIHHKYKTLPNVVERVASQRDIAPTILDIINIQIPDIFTGKSLQRTDQAPYFSDYYHSGMLGWIENDLLIEIPVSNPEKVSCFNTKLDKFQLKEDVCPENSLDAVYRSLSFTSRQQMLIFSGNLKNWLKNN